MRYWTLLAFAAPAVALGLGGSTLGSVDPALGFGGPEMAPRAVADDSPFVEGLKPGERESLLYVWSRDATGTGSDVLATIDADHESESYGKVIATAPTGSTGNEAHHFGYTANAGRIFAAGMFSNRIFIYDVASDPRQPRLIRTVDLGPTGFTGPHTVYAVPEGVLIAMLGAEDGGPPGGLVLLDDDGEFVRAYPATADGTPDAVHMYDVAVKPELNRMLTSSFAHTEHIRHHVPGPDQVGSHVAVWDWERKRIIQVAELDLAPLVIRGLRQHGARGGFVNCGFGGTVWFYEYRESDGLFDFDRVLELPEGSVPADMRVSPDDRFLYVSLWGGGEVRQYDISDPRSPRLVSGVEIPQPNMLKLSPDGSRLYVTNSILSTMDGDVEFGAWLFRVGPDGMERDAAFDPDFDALATGSAGPHDMTTLAPPCKQRHLLHAPGPAPPASVSSMIILSPAQLWSLVRRARLIRVLAVYFTAGFIVLQAVDIFVQQLGLPDWFFPGAIALLLIGLPIIIATALAQGAPQASTHGAETRLAGLPPAGAAAPGGERGAGTGAGTAHSGFSTTAAAASDPTEGAAPTSPATSSAELAAAARQWLTWRKAVMGGVLAFALLVLSVSGFMAMRNLGIGPIGSLVAAGVLDARERVLVADFQSQTGDTLLAGVLTEAFRVDLSQSPLVTVVDPGFVQDALERMARPRSTRLEADLARDLAQREGIKAVVAGEVGSAGAGYVISVRLLSPATQEVLAAFRETASDSTAVIGAVDRLSKRLRERVGESLRTIRANPPLEKVTTGSLEALRAYTQAVRLEEIDGERERAIALLEEALALDPEFAMAWRKLGVVLSNQGRDWTRAVGALEKAYEHRDRLTARERYMTLASYHSTVLGERDRAINAYLTLLDTYPDDHSALNNIALEHLRARDFPRAEEFYRRALRVDSMSAFPFTGLVSALYSQDKRAQADSAYAAAIARFPDNESVTRQGVHMALQAGDDAHAVEMARERVDADRQDVDRQLFANNIQGALALRHGRLAERNRLDTENLSLLERRGRHGQALGTAFRFAWVDLNFREDTVAALARVAAALEGTPLSSLGRYDRPYGELIALYAFADRPDLARGVLADFDTAMAADTESQWYVRARQQSESVIALAEDRPREAIALMRAWDEGQNPLWSLASLGDAFERAGEPDSAIVVYQKYVDQPYLYRIWNDGWDLARIYGRLAELYEESGDFERARLYNAQLIELWADADPELRHRVARAERDLARLVSERARP